VDFSQWLPCIRNVFCFSEIYRAELCDRFDVMSLGEHIEGVDGVEAVTACLKAEQVACEGRGVAGDVGDISWARGQYAFDDAFFRASAGRVEEDEIHGSKRCRVFMQPFSDE
jgi:hypothetical protein